MDIGDWLEQHGLGKYASVFAENEIDFIALPDITEDDLREMGLPIGPRRKLLKALRAPKSPYRTLLSTAEAERRQITVMFCDVVGSTALSTRVDPEELRDLLRTYQGVCGRVIHDIGGHVAQYLGDGLLVYFGYPDAQEKAARNAVEAGLEIIRDIRQSKALQTTGIDSLEVRIGVHTGPVVIGRMGDEHHQESLAVGETPNIAARMQGCAQPNQLVVSDATRKVAGEYFEYEDRGSQTLKGINTPVRLWRVVDRVVESLRAETDTATPGAFVGREVELNRLMSLWAQTRDGHSTFVVVSGEPGVGKSRLVEEVVRRAAAQGARRYAVRCDQRFSHSPFHPLVEFVKQIPAVDSDSPPWPEKVMGEDIHYLEALVGCVEPNGALAVESPETRRAKTMRALSGLFQSLGDAGPAICVWEDVHAADPSTLELFERLSDAAPVVPVLHLAASRPSDAPDWSRRPRISNMELFPLSDSDAKALAVATAREVALASTVLDQIVATADGVPLFVEEITKMLLESDWLQEQDGRRGFIQNHVPAAIPVTLQDLLMARLDQLPAGRALAQYAAAIGREFDDILLDAVVDTRVHKAGITQLTNAGLIQRINVTPPRFRFKHALISDTAYQSLLKSERRVYHAQIADAIERVTPEVAEAQPEIVAHHLTEAGRVERAVPLWQAAGERAMSRAANREALHHLETALNLLSELPHTATRDSQELELRMATGPVLITLKGNAAPEVEMSYERARQLCDRLRDDARAFAATFGLRSYYLTQADLAKSHTLGERLLDIATRNDDPDEKLEAHVALSNTFFFHGDFPAVQTHVDAGIALYRESRHASHVQTYGLDPGVICLSRAAQALWHRGFPDRATKVMGDAISLAERLQHPFTIAYVYDNAAVLYQWRRDGGRERRWAESAVALATQYDFPFFRAWGLMQAGHALVELGHVDDGLANMNEGTEIADSIGVLLMQPWFLATRGEACLRTQHIADGLKYVADAIAIVEHTGAVYALPALFWLNGELLMLDEGFAHFVEAQQSLSRAKEIAAQHGSRAFELRAAAALCRFSRSHGESDESTRWLAEVYGSFTEGFTTKDLQEAEYLLNERS